MSFEKSEFNKISSKIDSNIYIVFLINKDKQLNDYQKLIIKKFEPIRDKINFLFIDLFFDSNFAEVNTKNDLVFFDKNFAYNNIDVVKSCYNGVVLLERETVYFRKINKNNPVNEEMAINHNFQVAYLNPEEKENTNLDYKIIVENKNYIFNLNQILT